MERAAGAWCPRSQVSRTTREYLQVALPTTHVISAVLTQGRYDHGRGVEYTKAFTIEYWRSDIGWRNYSRWDGQKVRLILGIYFGTVKETSDSHGCDVLLVCLIPLSLLNLR